MVANQPPGVVHSCEFCEDKTTPGGPVDFTPEQQAEIKRQQDAAIAAAVAAATASLNAELTELKKGSEDAAIQARIDDAVATVAGEKAELQAKLDAEVAKAAAAEQELTDLKAFLEETAAAEKAAAEAAARKDERVAEVAKVIAFPEKYMEDSADRWAEMADEAFSAELEGFKVLAEAHNLKPKEPATAGEDGKGGAPTKRSAMTAAETAAAGAGSGRSRIGASREVMGLRNAGVDIRQLVK